MTAQPSNVANVTAALVAALRQDNRFQSVAVSRAMEINEQPSACPWVGIYRGSQRFVPRTLGATSGFMNQQIDLIAVIQAAGGTSGDECEDRIEELIASVISVVLSDISIGGTVHMVTGLDLRYRDYRHDGSAYMQTAELYITAETRVTVS